MKILLTGAGGQLGRRFHLAASARHEVIALDRRGLDIARARDVDAAIAGHRPAVVVNAAAYNDVDGAETDPGGARAANVDGPANLAHAASRHGALLVHVSTDYVFDGRKGSAYDEDDAAAPLSVYGRSKLDGENAVREGSTRHVVARTAWVYEASGSNFPRRFLDLARAGRALRIVSDAVGSPTSAAHLAAAILKVIEDGGQGTFHLAGGGPGASRYEVALALFKTMDLSVDVTPVASSEFPQKAIRPAFSVLRTIRVPPVVLPPWQDGIEEFAREIRSLETSNR